MRYASPPPTRNTPRREGTGPVQNKATREGAVPSLVATGITKQLLLLFGSAPFEGILGQTLQILGESWGPQFGATGKRKGADIAQAVRKINLLKLRAVPET